MKINEKIEVPWASGPQELLLHGLSLLKIDSDSNRRIAMICIDNSVELMIKTYLGLPKRLSGINISRKEYSEINESFSSLLDAVEKYATDKISGIDIGEIEWFHRLRNQLYHQGNGLTIERKNIDVYAEIANLLFNNLYGVKLVPVEDDSTRLLGNFMEAWIIYEKSLKDYFSLIKGQNQVYSYFNSLWALREQGILSQEEIEELQKIRSIRNEVVHGKKSPERLLTKKIVNQLNSLSNRIIKTIRKN